MITNDVLIIAGFIAILGASAGAIGSFAIVTRQAMLTDAISHAALPGIAIAYLATGKRDFWLFFLCASLCGFIVSLTVLTLKRIFRVPSDAALAFGVASSFAFGMLLLQIVQNQPGGMKAGLQGFLFGKAASMINSDFAAITVFSLVVLLILPMFFREFTMVAFDKLNAHTQGVRVAAMEAFFGALLVAGTIVSLPAVGAVVAMALFIIPASIARIVCKRMSTVVLVSALVGAFGGSVGTIISVVAPMPDGLGNGWPTGPVVVLFLGFLLILAVFLRTDKVPE